MSAIGEGYALINTLVQHADGAPPPPLTDEKVDQIRAVLLHPELKLQDGATVRQLGKTLRKCKWNPDSRHDKSPFHLLQALIGLRASACSKNQPCAHRAQGLLSALERLRDKGDESALNELLAAGETVTVKELEKLSESSGIDLNTFQILQDEQGKLVALLKNKAGTTTDPITVTKRNCLEFRNRASIPALASIVNRFEVNLNLLSLDQRRLKAILPQPSYCMLKNLDPYTQSNAVTRLSFSKVVKLSVKSDRILALPKEMDKLKYLDCSDCPLTSLPDGMDELETLYCNNCPLTSLPEGMGKLRNLHCSYCPLLSLPKGMGDLKSLYCYACPLASLPERMDELEELYCPNCPELRSLPAALPRCTFLNIEDCPHLGNRILPELPPDATVHGVGSQFDYLSIPRHKIPEFPLHFLSELGSKLLNNRPFPNITYLEPDGTLSRAVDLGGVRRDFVSTILENLFTDTQDLSKLQRINSFPHARSNDEHDAYCNLGRLLGLCYLGTQANFVSGTLFDSNFYRALSVYPHTTRTALALMGLPAELEQIVEGSDEASEEAYEKARSLLDEDFEKADLADFEKQRAYFRNPMHRQELEEQLIQNSKEPPIAARYQALEWIAVAMKELLGQEQWKQLQASTSDALKTKIEGSLDNDQIKKALAFSGGEPSDQTILKGWLTDFLGEANNDTLKLFLKAITSSNALKPGSTITIELYDRDPQQIPIAHTCINTLEIPKGYPDYETFKGKLELLLVQADKGFDFA